MFHLIPHQNASFHQSGGCSAECREACLTGPTHRVQFVQIGPNQYVHHWSPVRKAVRASPAALNELAGSRKAHLNLPHRGVGRQLGDAHNQADDDRQPETIFYYG